MLKDILLITVFPAAMALSAATDLFTMTVPNRIAIALVAGFVVLAPLVGLGWPELGIHVALAAVALVLGFVMFSFGWIGGGDAKLFAATCLWLGPETMFSYGMLTALFGGALTLGPPVLAAVPASRDAQFARLARQAAQPARRSALRHRARRRGAHGLPANSLYGCPRGLELRAPSLNRTVARSGQTPERQGVFAPLPRRPIWHGH